MCRAHSSKDSSAATAGIKQNNDDIYLHPKVSVPKSYGDASKEWKHLPGDDIHHRWVFRVLIVVPFFGLLACFFLENATYMLTLLNIILFYVFLFESLRKFIIFPKWFYSVARSASASVAATTTAECHGWKHLIVLPVYQDSAATVVASLRALNKQSIAHAITVMVTFEERSVDKKDKIRQIREAMAGHKLDGLYFTIHPKNLPGEIPGMGSNAMWGSHQLMDRLGLVGVDTTSPRLNKRSLTIADCDIIMHPTFFATVSQMFHKEKEPDRAFYQSSVLFYLNMASGHWLASAFSRWFAGYVAAETISNNHAMFLPQKYMMPLPINTMTVTLRTALAAGFNHPGRVPADVVYYARALMACRGHMIPRTVPSIVFTETATADTVVGLVHATMIQWSRWTRGHYQVIDSLVWDTVKSFKDPLALVLWWMQLLYVKVWYGSFWELHLSMIILPVAPSLTSEEIIANFGIFGSFFVSHSWIRLPLDLFLTVTTILGTEYFANHIMGKHFEKEELNSSFGFFQTLAHMSVGHLLHIPNFFVQWTALCQEFFGGKRTFVETPKHSMQKKLTATPEVINKQSTLKASNSTGVLLPQGSSPTAPVTYPGAA